MQNFKFFIIPFLLGAVFWFVVFLFLPKTTIFFANIDRDYNYYNINLVKLFFNQKQQNTIKKTPTSTEHSPCLNLSICWYLIFSRIWSIRSSLANAF